MKRDQYFAAWLESGMCWRCNKDFLGAEPVTLLPTAEPAALEAKAAIADWLASLHHEYPVDGFDIQEKLVEMGVLVPVEVAEPCGETCACRGFFPTTCYRRAKAAKWDAKEKSGE